MSEFQQYLTTELSKRISHTQQEGFGYFHQYLEALAKPEIIKSFCNLYKHLTNRYGEKTKILLTANGVLKPLTLIQQEQIQSGTFDPRKNFQDIPNNTDDWKQSIAKALEQGYTLGGENLFLKPHVTIFPDRVFPLSIIINHLSKGKNISLLDIGSGASITKTVLTHGHNKNLYMPQPLEFPKNILQDYPGNMKYVSIDKEYSPKDQKETFLLAKAGLRPVSVNLAIYHTMDSLQQILQSGHPHYKDDATDSRIITKILEEQGTFDYLYASWSLFQMQLSIHNPKDLETIAKKRGKLMKKAGYFIVNDFGPNSSYPGNTHVFQWSGKELQSLTPGPLFIDNHRIITSTDNNFFKSQ